MCQPVILDEKPGAAYEPPGLGTVRRYRFLHRLNNLQYSRGLFTQSAKTQGQFIPWLLYSDAVSMFQNNAELELEKKPFQKNVLFGAKPLI